MDSDLHEGTRKAALRLLAETGLFRGAGAAKESDVASILANSLKLSGPTRPFIPTPWRATDALAGAQGAMAALCILLEGLKGRKETTAELDVEAGTFVALAQFLLNWEVPGGGYWHETTILFNKMLEEKLASSKPAASGVKGVIKPVSSSEELVDPPAGTSANSPLFHALRTFLGDVFPTKDRHIFLFMLSQDHPNKYLAAMGFNSDEVSQLIRLAITTPETHPKTFLAHHEDFLRQIKARLLTQMAFDVEERIRAIPAIAVVPRTREEFEKTEQGRILSQLPRMAVERANEVRGPRTVEEWGSVLSGKTSDGAPGLWPETGWSYGSIPAGLPTRGVLYGVKVLEITRIVAGPICGLQLAQLGADVMRISSADIFDYPTHELNINLNKRSVEMDLKSPAGKARFRELLMDADVVVNNLLAGTMDKLEFGLKDVLEIIKGRGKGIVYAESNTFGFYGALMKLPGVELLGQHMTGVSVVQGDFQTFTDPNVKMPTVAPLMMCDVTTGLSLATGILSALYRRSQVGGSYLVRGSLTQSALFVQDLGKYQDEAMVRSLFDGYPLHEVEVLADTTASAHTGDLDYLVRLPRWMAERKVRGTTWESGFWMRTVDVPIGGSVVSYIPPIKLSCHSKDMRHLRYVSRQLRYDPWVGWLFDPTDAPGSDEEVRDLIPIAGKERTYTVRKKADLMKEMGAFLESKGKRLALDGATVRL